MHAPYHLKYCNIFRFVPISVPTTHFLAARIRLALETGEVGLRMKSPKEMKAVPQKAESHLDEDRTSRM